MGTQAHGHVETTLESASKSPKRYHWHIKSVLKKRGALIRTIILKDNAIVAPTVENFVLVTCNERVYRPRETSSDALDELARTERGAAAVAPPAAAAACNYSRHSILHAHALTNTNKPLLARWQTHVRSDAITHLDRALCNAHRIARRGRVARHHGYILRALLRPFISINPTVVSLGLPSWCMTHGLVLRNIYESALSSDHFLFLIIIMSNHEIICFVRIFYCNRNCAKWSPWQHT